MILGLALAVAFGVALGFAEGLGLGVGLLAWLAGELGFGLGVGLLVGSGAVGAGVIDGDGLGLGVGRRGSGSLMPESGFDGGRWRGTMASGLCDEGEAAGIA